MGSAGEAAAMEAGTHQESGSLLNKVYAMQCAQQQQQQQSTVLTVVGGRMVSRSAPMPLNGQQLMMQLDGLTSAMTGMSVQEEAMESTEEEDDSPYSQTCRSRDLSSSSLNTSSSSCSCNNSISSFLPTSNRPA